MKKEYLPPQIIKYDSLREMTLQLTAEMPPACTGGNPVPGCSGSCYTLGFVGYKRSDADCPP